jgi:glycosyltransferase involved in cell wall biosynthesis
LVLPSPAADTTTLRRVFYHGTASHDAEKRWLRPIVAEAVRRDDRLVFEIIGGQRVNRLYRGLPRVSVVHQMTWSAYQAFIAFPGRHIGLAPLLDSPFNRARSYTKFFDITHCGAVGIYSPNGACAEVVRHGMDGLLVELEEEAWVEAILSLVRDEPLRRGLLRNARARLGELRDVAQRGYAELIRPPAAD